MGVEHGCGCRHSAGAWFLCRRHESDHIDALTIESKTGAPDDLPCLECGELLSEHDDGECPTMRDDYPEPDR